MMSSSKDMSVLHDGGLYRAVETIEAVNVSRGNNRRVGLLIDSGGKTLAIDLSRDEARHLSELLIGACASEENVEPSAS